MDVEVLSYDPVTDRIVPRKVVNWFNNGPAEQFLQFTVEKSGGNGKSQFAAHAEPPHPHTGRLDGGRRPQCRRSRAGCRASSA